ncbi:UDP-glycosyltransferase 71B7 [Linum perenne]
MQQLVFIPFPGVGHLVSMVELAKLLVHHNSTFSISLLVITSHSTLAGVTRYNDSFSSDLTHQINLESTSQIS